MTIRCCVGRMLFFSTVVFPVAGCRTGEGLGLEVVGEAGLIRGATGGGGTTLRLAGALGEVLGGPITFRSDHRIVSAPQLRVFDLQGSDGVIGSSAVELFRVHRVAVDRFPGWHIRSIPASSRDPAPLDVLVPLSAPRGGTPNLLSPGVAYHFWVDVHIPLGVAGGTYRSRIALLSREREVGGIDLELTVWPMVLPQEIGFETIAELDHAALIAHHLRGGASFEVEAALQGAVRQLRRHRVTGVFPQLCPAVGIDGSGRVALDWEAFDGVVGPLLSGAAFPDHVPATRWPVPVHSSIPLTSGESPSRRRLLLDYLSEAITHFRQRGWDDRLYLLTRDPQSRTDVAPGDLAELVSGVRDHVRLVSTIPAQDLGALGWSSDGHQNHEKAVDEWAPSAQFLDRRMVERARGAGKGTWFCVDRPPFCGSLEITAPFTFARVLAWQAASVGASCLYLGRILDWPAPTSHPSIADCARRNPANLLFPGTTFGLVEPVATLRLKQLRRGLQDVGYLRLLGEHGRSALAERVLWSMVTSVGTAVYDAHYADGSRIGWPDEPGAFDAARRIMAEEMVRVAETQGGAPNENGFGRTAAWRRFNQITRRPALVAEGVRMRMTGSPSNPQVNLAAHLALEHRSPGPETGTLRLEDWPASWSVGSSVETFRLGGERQPHRTFFETVVPLDSVVGEGALDLSGVAEFEDGRRAGARVAVRCVTALRCDRPPQIDGDLSDWPVGGVNVASHFQSIAPSSEGEGQASRAPMAATAVFLMRDDESLFVAVNAETSDGTPEESGSRKSVVYDDTIPVGEELIELLFDPLNLATRSPESIYHIAIKRSGSDFAEKGVRFAPPVGRRGPWAADVDVAVATGQDRWIAEVRIPLSAFGSGPFRHVFWGFNVTRFDVARSEFSTWAGCEGNAYDPISFGNLLFLE